MAPVESMLPLSQVQNVLHAIQTPIPLTYKDRWKICSLPMEETSYFHS